MRIENSPAYEAQMAAYEKKRARKKSTAEKLMARTIRAGHGQTWTEMTHFPFLAFDLLAGSHDFFLVTDGKSVTVASVNKRFGSPVFWKKQPEMIFRDGMMCLEGGEVDPRDDLPKWWWKWEIKDELESETYAYGESAGQPEIDFLPTHWMFIPPPPQFN